MFSTGDDQRALFNTVTASQVLQSVLKQVTGDPTVHFHHLRHTFNSRIYPGLFDIADHSFNNYIQRLSGGYSCAPDNLRLLLTGRRHESSHGLKALSVASGHSQVTTTFRNYIHTADHHIHYVSSLPYHWRNISISRVDYITSYAHGKKCVTLAKLRNRKGIGSDDLHGALSAANDSLVIPASGIVTIPHPKNETLIMETTSHHQALSLVDIDEVLLIYCTQETPSPHVIAQSLFLDLDDVIRIIELFNHLKRESKYMGYHNYRVDTHATRSQYDTEPRAETLSLRREMSEVV